MSVAGEARPLQPRDQLALESIGSFFGGAAAFSPDGRWLALARIRSPIEGPSVQYWNLRGHERGDVWLYGPEGSAENLTRGVQDGTGWLSPAWSPSGRYLAMLSTRDPEGRASGDGLWLWVWDAQTRRLRGYAYPAVEPLSFYGPALFWDDDGHVVLTTPPPGERSAVVNTSALLAPRYWRAARAGMEVTSSVLDSGGPAPRRVHSQVLRISVASATSQTLFEFPRSRTLAEPNVLPWRLSPDRSRIAIGFAERANSPSRSFRLGIFGMNGEVVDVPTSFETVVPDSARWSDSGRQLAFLAVVQNTSARQPVLVIWDASSGRFRRIDTPGLEMPDGSSPLSSVAMEWNGDDGLAIRAGATRSASANDTRSEWWWVPLRGRPRNLTGAMTQKPTDLFREEGAERFVAVADGRLWRIDPRAGTTTPVSLPGLGTIERLDWPTRTRCAQRHACLEAGQEVGRLIVSATDGAKPSRRFEIDLARNEATPIQTVDPQVVVPAANDAGAQVIAYHSSSGRLLTYEAGRNGMRVDVTETRRPHTTNLVAGNLFLQDIEDLRHERLDYTSEAGEQLTGWLTVPPDYVAGRRYPTIVWIYPGDRYNATYPAYWLVGSTVMTPDILAGMGYVVINPSIPLTEWGELDDPLQRLADGILPAIDAAIARGFIDPARVFIAGHSYGGYGVYGLIGQTDRFCAAAAIDGITDLRSMFGTFSAETRYSPDVDPLQSGPSWMNTQGRMMAPPWEDPARYERNSPINFVDRVTTPLLMIHGDLDNVPIGQAEQFYTSLARLNRRARLVRYWGELHYPRSPANWTDMYDQVRTWFDELGGQTRNAEGQFLWEGERLQGTACPGRNAAGNR